MRGSARTVGASRRKGRRSIRRRPKWSFARRRHNPELTLARRLGCTDVNRNISIYLDLLRIAAALAVFIGHAQGYLLPSIPKLIASHSQEGVAVFFVLSGFVIRFVTEKKESNWQSYAFARFTRIFSVVPIALFVTYVADLLGQMRDPAFYASISWYGQMDAISLLRAVTFTNEVWGQSSVFGSNHAYWSLGFEVQYYIVFGLLCFVPKRFAPLAFLTWGLLVGPLIVLYFTLWLCGVLTFELVRSKRFRSRAFGGVLVVASLLLYAIVKFGFRDYKLSISEWAYIAQLAPSYAYYIAVGLAVVMNVVGMSRLIDGLSLFGPRMEAIVRWVAGGTFSLYLVHQPLLTLGRAILPDYPDRSLAALFAVVLNVVVCYLVAELGERRKNLYKAVFMAGLR